ncbi:MULTISPECIES: transglycosylase SLT domain-containing protein [Streptomyces]|uniref:transglycosylase SLT domain-containing protein n=1 Tax=Streptomyces TaxID=1883 RepID=UPI00163BB50D|nr:MULTISPECIES: transglycosylase SLT domain-containing protein [Streptomyces]MBC2876555.1 transglycosylase SLT domain-containing protein [Streptomyces sp. TYQ1024]UBI40774.1 transglycosylase SLT domain-containing protein [Streptomyces mobaraensis]
MRSTHSGYTRLSKVHKFSAAGLGAAGAAAVAFAVVSGGTAVADARPVVKPVAFEAKAFEGQGQGEAAHKSDEAAARAKAEAAAKVKADKDRAEKQAANRSTARKPMRKPAAPAAPAPKAYGNDLEGWISQALDIMKAKGIPASYEGVKRNIMRESTGNPHAINDWDVNAVNGVPSKGLLQIIDPTFKAYHVEGTSWDIWDPVANIVASCNYAADKYGSMDNVNSAY